MCCGDKNKQGCKKPESLKGKRKDCSGKQACECHSGVKGHCCGPKEGKSNGLSQ